MLDVDERLHYFQPEGNEFRPGLYQHFMGTPVPSFEDPVLIARKIAESLVKPLTEPKNPGSLKVQSVQARTRPRPNISMRPQGSTGHPDAGSQGLHIRLSSSETIFNFGAIVLDQQLMVQPT